MLYLQPNQTNTIVVTFSERATSTSAAYYLLEVTHIATLVKTLVVIPKASNLSSYARYDKFEIIAQFSSEGQYTYTAYEATGVTLNTAIAVVESGLMLVAMTEQSYVNAGGDTLYVQAGDNTVPLNPAPAPLIITNAGVYAGFVQVQVSGTIAGNIYYTTDGTTPSSQNGTLYNDNDRPIIQLTALFQARLYSDGYTLGEVAAAYYIIIPLAVSAVPTGGLFLQGQLDPIVLESNNEDALIYFTLDGSEPTEASTLFSAAIARNQNTTLRFRSFLPLALPSPIVTETYQVKALAPTLDTTSGTFISNKVITATNPNPSGTLEYRINGGSYIASGVVNVTESATVDFRVVASGIYETSDLASVVIEIQCAAPTLIPSTAIFDIDEEILYQNNEAGGITYYTTNGSVPTQSSLTLNPFTITATTTVRARTFRSGCTPSVIVEGVYTKLFKSALAGAFNGRISQSENAFATWAELNIFGLNNQTWTDARIGDEGLNAQVITNTDIRYSTNQFGTWQASTLPSPIVSINRMTASKSGAKVGIVANIGNSRNQVLISLDGGATFVDRSPNLATFAEVGYSPDGTKLYCTKIGNASTNVNDDVVYYSDNDGLTWAATLTQNQRRAASLFVTDNAIYFMLFNSATDSLIGFQRSVNNGVTLVPITGAGTNYRRGWASGNDGVIVLASVLQTDILRVSTDQGATWSNFTLPANLTTIRISSSHDATRWMIGTTTRLYTSLNSMASVTETQPAGNVDRTWQLAATLS